MNYKENTVKKARVKIGCDTGGIETFNLYEGKVFDFIYKQVEGYREGYYAWYIKEDNNDPKIEDPMKDMLLWDEDQLDFNDVDEGLEIKIKYHVKDIDKIEKIEQGDWIDLRSAYDYELKQGESIYIHLGVSIKLPEGYEARLAPRSSTFKNFGITQTNSVGVVDESYCGDFDIWMLPVKAERDTIIKKNDRICQFRIDKKMPKVKIIEVENMEDESRGGFGSTGKN